MNKKHWWELKSGHLRISRLYATCWFENCCGNTVTGIYTMPQKDLAWFRHPYGGDRARRSEKSADFGWFSMIFLMFFYKRILRQQLPAARSEPLFMWFISFFLEILSRLVLWCYFGPRSFLSPTNSHRARIGRYPPSELSLDNRIHIQSTRQVLIL